MTDGQMDPNYTIFECKSCYEAPKRITNPTSFCVNEPFELRTRLGYIMVKVSEYAVLLITDGLRKLMEMYAFASKLTLFDTVESRNNGSQGTNNYFLL